MKEGMVEIKHKTEKDLLDQYDELETIDHNSSSEESEESSDDDEEAITKPRKIQKIKQKPSIKRKQGKQYAMLQNDEYDAYSIEEDDRKSFDNLLDKPVQSYNCCFGYCHWQRYHPIICILIISSIVLFIAAIVIGFIYDTPDSIWSYTNVLDNIRKDQGKILEETIIPSNLSDICSATNPNMLKECRDACRVSQCCTTSKKSKNCFLHHVITCSKYTPCAILLEYGSGPYSTIPKAPPHLDTICSLDNIKSMSSSYNTCKAACEIARCCTITDDSKNCFLENVFICMSYTACDSLSLVTNVPVDDGKEEEVIDKEELTLIADVATKCSSTNLDKGTCEKLCRSRECCFVDKNSISNCYNDNKVWCDELASCSNLGALSSASNPTKSPTTAPTSDSKLKPPSQQLKQICSAIETNSTAKTQCINQCQVSSCCIQPLDSIKSCLRDNVPACEEYFHCCEDVYDFVSLDDDDAVDMVDDETFDEESVLKDSGNVDETNEVTQNTNEENTENTNEYISPTYIKVAKAPSYLKNICSLESLQENNSDNEQLCNDLCLPAIECCLNRKINCNYQEVCDGYQNCDNIWREDGYFNSQDIEVIDNTPVALPTAPVASPVSTPYPSELEDFINGVTDDLMSVEGEEDDVNLTYDEFQEDPMVEQAIEQEAQEEEKEIQNNVTPALPPSSKQATDIPNPPSYLSDACDSTNISTEDGKAICSQLCRPAAKCCTTTDLATSCNSYDPICKLYESCLMVWYKEGYFGVDQDQQSEQQTQQIDQQSQQTLQQVLIIPNPPNELPDICNFEAIDDNAEEFQRCGKFCKPAYQCCFKANGSDENCNRNLDVCRKYKPCMHYWGQITSQPDTTTSESVNKSDESMNDTSYESMNNDKMNDPPAKQEIIKIPNPSNELSDYCELETIKNSEHDYNTCNSMCTPAYDCCTSTDTTTNCNKNLEICQKYKSCFNLWNMDQNKLLQESTNDLMNKDVGTVNATLTEVCKPSNLGTEEGRLKCETECHVGLCCIGIRGDCSTSMSTICNIYSNSCRRIWMTLGYYKTQTGETIVPINLNSQEGYEKEKSDTDITVVQTLCSKDNLKTVTGQKACSDVCDNWSCCWDVGEGGCYASYELECNAHLICN